MRQVTSPATHSHTLSLSHTLAHSLSHTHTLTLTHTHNHTQVVPPAHIQRLSQPQFNRILLAEIAEVQMPSPS